MTRSMTCWESRPAVSSTGPKISIIIATFNADGYIQKSLLSIQNQNFKDIEIIIVDDNSKDNTINKRINEKR